MHQYDKHAQLKAADTHITPCFPVCHPFSIRVFQCFKVVPVLSLIDLDRLLSFVELGRDFVHILALSQTESSREAVDVYAVVLVLFQGLW